MRRTSSRPLHGVERDLGNAGVGDAVVAFSALERYGGRMGARTEHCLRYPPGAVPTTVPLPPAACHFHPPASHSFRSARTNACALSTVHCSLLPKGFLTPNHPRPLEVRQIKYKPCDCIRTSIGPINFIGTPQPVQVPIDSRGIHIDYIDGFWLRGRSIFALFS